MWSMGAERRMADTRALGDEVDVAAGVLDLQPDDVERASRPGLKLSGGGGLEEADTGLFDEFAEFLACLIRAGITGGLEGSEAELEE